MEQIQYKLKDDGNTIGIGRLTLEESLIKDYFNIGDILLNPCIELNKDNETKRIHLSKVTNQWIGTLYAFGFNFGIKIETLKNDKSKSSLYLKITSSKTREEGSYNA